MDALLDLDRLAGQLLAAVAFLIPGLNTMPENVEPPIIASVDLSA
jgi:hypothetical protein